MSITLAGYTLPDPLEVNIAWIPDGENRRMSDGQYEFIAYSTLPVRRQFTLHFGALTSSQRDTVATAYAAAVQDRVALVMDGVTYYVRALDQAGVRFEHDGVLRWKADVQLTEVP